MCDVRILDISSKNLTKLTNDLLKQVLESDADRNSLVESIEVILADNNSLAKLECLDSFVNVRKLSMANNRLVEMRQINRLVRLEILNVARNSLTSFENFRQLQYLRWINISGNQIKVGFSSYFLTFYVFI